MAKVSTRMAAVIGIMVAALSAHADPAGTCADACQRIAQCKLSPFHVCVDYCKKTGADRTAEARATNARQARSSCSDLAAQMRPGQWVCSAGGQSITQYAEGGTWEPDTVYILGSAKTRQEAAFNALRDCRAIMTFNMALAESSTSVAVEHTRVDAECQITACYPPGR